MINLSYGNIQSVAIDEEEETFTIIRDNGNVQQYNIYDEIELYLLVLDKADQIDIYDVKQLF